MKQVFVFAVAAIAATASAQETGRVLSSVPVIQQVAVQRQVCTSQPVAAQPQTSGMGGLFGALVGAAIGSQVGGGSGRLAATMAGTMGGALLGNSAEAQGAAAQPQMAQHCTPQATWENRTVGYDVTYEFAGREYTARMPSDPGPTVQLQVTPVPPARPAAASGALVTAPPVSEAPPVVLPPETLHTTVYPSYTVVRPAPHYWYPPVVFSIGYTHVGGHWHRRWR